MRATNNTQAENLAQAKRNAKFAGHKIERTGPRSWVCKEPGKSNYWYQVYVGPACVVVSGDLGDVVLNPHSERDPLNWCMGAKEREWDYVLGKAAHSQRVKEFSAGEAKAWLVELESGDEHDAQEALEVRREWDGETEASFGGAAWGASDDPPCCRVFTVEAFTCFLALLWLMERLGPDGEVTKDGVA